MSIIIKGVKMPKEGNYSARLNVNRDGTALLFLYGECGGHEAKELPPHGRLIDATKLCELCDIMADKCGDSSMWKQVRSVVEDLPTIIEGDKE